MSSSRSFAHLQLVLEALLALEVPGDAVLQQGNLGGRRGQLGDLGLEQRLLLHALGLFRTGSRLRLWSRGGGATFGS